MDFEPDETVEPPYATLDEDVYSTEQVTLLGSYNDDDEIYYSIGMGNNEFVKYEGEPIYLNRSTVDEDNMLVIHAYIAKDGEPISAVAGFFYRLDERVPVPSDDEVVYTGDAWTILAATEDYSVEQIERVDGPGLNEDYGVDTDGDAFAVNVGTYKVTLKIAPKLSWETDELEPYDEFENEPAPDYEDKIVTFTITKAENTVTTTAKTAKQTTTYSPNAASALAANVNVSNAQGAVTYTNASTNAYARNFAVNAKTGAVTVPKGTPAGTYTVVVRATAAGDNSYAAGSSDVSFVVEVKPLPALIVSPIANQTYSGGALMPTPKVTCNGKELREGVDYTLTYANNTQAGTATVTVTGKGAYAGTKPVTSSFRIDEPPCGVSYRTHVQTFGWQKYVNDGDLSGTTGKSKRLEGINIKLNDHPYAGGIQYRTHVQRVGWQGWRKDGAMAGTKGKSLRLEAIEIKLYGELANHYDVYYRVHCQRFGWMGWAKNGERSGSAGYSRRLEGIQVVLVKKGDPAPPVAFKGVTQRYSVPFRQKGK